MAFGKNPSNQHLQPFPSTTPQASTSSTVKPVPSATRPNFSKAQTKAPRIDKQAVLDATDILELIGEHVELRLRSRAKSEYIGLCPFHNDSNASFEVNASSGLYSCWSCSAGVNGSNGGDAITFVRRYFGVGFKDALGILAQRAGMDAPSGYSAPSGRAAHPVRSAPRPPKEVPNGLNPDLSANKAVLLGWMARAQKAFSENLSKSPDIQRYLSRKRGVGLGMMSRFAIGYAPNSFDTLRKLAQSEEEKTSLFDAGLLRKSEKGMYYDFFRDRLTFGVRDDDGQVIAFGGRRVSDEVALDAQGKEVRIAKYMNSPETAIFSKSEALFGLYEAKKDIHKEGFVLVVEGYMDVVGLAARGVGNAVACMGTSLTRQHVERLVPLTKKIVFCFDGDTAGFQASFRSLSSALPYLDASMELSFLNLPGGLDPDDYIRERGKDALLEEINRAQGLTEFWQESLQRLYPLDQDGNKERLLENAWELVRLVPKDSPWSSRLEQSAKLLAQAEQGPSKREISSTYGVNASHARGASDGMRSEIANEPTQRLLIASQKLPDVALEVRREMDGAWQEKTLAKWIETNPGAQEEVGATLHDWLARFDEAIESGYRQIVHSKSAEPVGQEGIYRAIIRAAPAILTQVLRSAIKASEKVQSDQVEDEQHQTISDAAVLSNEKPCGKRATCRP